MNIYKNLYTTEERKQLIAAELLSLRSERGYTQKEVAEALEMKTGTYNAYEKMRSEPSAEIIVRLAYFYDVSTDEILQKDNLLKDPEIMAEKVKEFQNTMTELQKAAKDGNKEAQKLQEELISKSSMFFGNLLNNVVDNKNDDK